MFEISSLVAAAGQAITAGAVSAAIGAPPLPSGAHAPSTSAALELKPYVFRTSDGHSEPAEWGTITVPEKRRARRRGSITLSFVRFKSTSPRPGPPIFFLAGGPGNSAIEAGKGPRFPLFMAARRHGDMILLDQRGIGASKPRLDCEERVPLPRDRPVTRAAYLKSYRKAAQSCASALRRRGIDLSAYNTNESADDLDDIRSALGAEKMVLWGLSYGGHLGLITIRRHPDRVARAILAGVEGQDYTAKLPSTYRAHLRQLAQMVRRDPELGREIPDLEAMMETVVSRLNRQPQPILIKDVDTGVTSPVMLNGTLFSWALFDVWGSDGVAYIPWFLLHASRGDFEGIAELIGRQGSGVGSAMHGAMDCASAVSPQRQRQVDSQSGDTLFADINFPYMEACTGWGVKPLGPRFWAPVKSHVPVLFISGTLDAKTPPFQAEEIRRGFPASSHLVVEGAVHSDPLFLSNPRIKEVMLDFLSGIPVPDKRLVADPIRFIMENPFAGQ